MMVTGLAEIVLVDDVVARIAEERGRAAVGGRGAWRCEACGERIPVSHLPMAPRRHDGLCYECRGAIDNALAQEYALGTDLLLSDTTVRATTWQDWEELGV